MSALAPDALLDRPVSALGPLTTRALQCLRSENLSTVRVLLEHTEQELMRIPNFGRKSLAEIKGVLDDYGLALRHPDTPDGTMPLPFPSVHVRLMRMEEAIARMQVQIARLEQVAGIEPGSPIQPRL